MYKIKHLLFGWDYIHWENWMDSGIAKVHKMPDGKIVYWRYSITGSLSIIKNADDVTWLTCHPAKYGFN
jgi:hypothetical protein